MRAFKTIQIELGSISFNPSEVKNCLPLIQTTQEQITFIDGVLSDIGSRIFEEKRALQKGLVAVWNAGKATYRPATSEDVETSKRFIEICERQKEELLPIRAELQKKIEKELSPKLTKNDMGYIVLYLNEVKKIPLWKNVKGTAREILTKVPFIEGLSTKNAVDSMRSTIKRIKADYRDGSKAEQDEMILKAAKIFSKYGDYVKKTMEWN